MLLVTYDINNDKLRNKFSKFLEKFGFRLQYSVFEIQNSDKVLKNIQTEIECSFLKAFTESDSVIIFDINDSCKKMSFGYAKNEDTDIFMIT